MTTPPGARRLATSRAARPQRWSTFVLSVIALVAIGLAIEFWFRPLPSTQASLPSAPIYTDQQIASAKANVCAVFAKVDHALDVSSGRGKSDDPAMQLAIATSGPQVLEANSGYLLTKLAEEPATPPDIANEVRKFANSSQELVIGYLDGLTASYSELQSSLQTGDETTLAVRRLCK